ncbi:hypothetical protein GCM10010156_59750 [Planobispora rosea]|uniref:Lipoyl-binding domain-containing protein n=1 Tax=Planobispora rosea TaxID=35762 RepID=A0A8J3S3V3_PLARO|nr:HlyD family efflux transporter periplasmic adaptor subunit [Planobispora rosea]GGS93526.1 hypothetical protein GCM10010156_59750 [Planobispora rosea]GIH87277.1 hypothetical protein Pro02_56850 [Planobispora rosea]
MQFRFKALQRMREPDELDSVTSLARPRGWIAVLVVTALIAGAGVWAFAGRLPYTVRAEGLLTRPLGVAPLHSTLTGLVRDVRVAPADDVRAGQLLGEVVTARGKVEEIRAPFAGRVVSVAIGHGQAVSHGTTVATVERTDAPDDRLLAMLFVPGSAAGVEPGRPVDLSVASAPVSRYGVLHGTVTSVSPYPLTKAALTSLLGDPVIADRYFLNGLGPRLVVVDLVRNSRTPTGYDWSAQGGPQSLQSQVHVTGSIKLGGRTPITFVLGQ